MYESLEQRIGYQFKDPSLLRLALTHPSSIGALGNIQGSKSALSNQRLEFLGDSILNLILSVFLVDKYPTAGEGMLTNLRTSFVCGKALAFLGQELEIAPLVIKESHYEIRENDIADVVEALIAAVYMDGDLHSAERVIYNIFGDYLDKGLNVFVDHKSNLQKLIHKKYKSVEATYVIEEIPEKQYKCFVYVKHMLIAHGVGVSKKKAAEVAAEEACKILNEAADILVD
jgi:ribonuclease-3